LLINNTPEITTDGSLDAPFGKRLYDEAVVKKLKGVKRLKFWGTFLLIVVITILLEVATSNRVFKLTARPIEFETTVDKVRIEGDRIIIPALVVQYQRDTTIPNWARAKVTPIQVLNFANAKEIPPGAEGKAVLLTGATNGLIKARLTEPVKVDGVSLLDAGTLLIGQGRSTEERLYVDFKKAVYRDGKSVSISAQAYDISDTILGLKGSRVGDVTLKLAASSGLNFLSGMAIGMQTPSYDQFGRPLRPKVGDAALNGVSQAAAEQSKTYMEDIKNRPPIIEVKSGTVFTVTFDGGGQ
jgi:hypothetical protein